MASFPDAASTTSYPPSASSTTRVCRSCSLSSATRIRAFESLSISRNLLKYEGKTKAWRESRHVVPAWKQSGMRGHISVDTRNVSSYILGDMKELIGRIRKFFTSMGLVEQSQVVASTAVVVAMVTIVTSHVVIGRSFGWIDFISIVTVGVIGFVSVFFTLKYGRMLEEQRKEIFELNM